MAGKKKKVQDETLNKTARKNQQKGSKKEGFIAAAPEHLKRIISLGGGTHAYLLDPRDGRTWHLRVNSTAWDILLTELNATPHGVHIRAEIARLGWRDPITEQEALMAEVEANDAALFAALEKEQVDAS